MKTTTNCYQAKAIEPTKPTEVRILQLPEVRTIGKLTADPWVIGSKPDALTSETTWLLCTKGWRI